MNIGLSIGTNIVSALLGRQILTQAISDASSTIYTSVGEIFYYVTYVDKVLYELDIINKIRTMELLCKNINNRYDPLNKMENRVICNNEPLDLNALANLRRDSSGGISTGIVPYNPAINNVVDEALCTCLDNLHDMIIRIREDLNQIRSKIEFHKSKYFNYWRSVDVKPQLVNLRLHSKLLDDRYDLLLKTMSIYKIIF